MSDDRPKNAGSSDRIREVEAVRYSGSDAPGSPERTQVVVEQPLTVMVEGVGDFTIMCTPHDLKALAVGFVFSEGMIASVSDIHLLAVCEDDPGAIRMKIRNPGGAFERNLVVASSCGMCGSRNIAEVLAGLPRCRDSLRVEPTLLNGVIEEMGSRQELFRATGAAHAAAIFSADGRVLAFGEDIGRHNALDKAVGKCLLSDQNMAGCAVALSGRVSFELVAKAARAGIELIAAVSAPTSLALDVAEKAGITLCAFVRDDRATVYTQPHRIAS